MTRITSLPTEVLERVLDHLSRLDLLKLRKVDRQFKELVQVHTTRSLPQDIDDNEDDAETPDEAHSVDILQHQTQVEEEAEEAQARDVIELEKWDKRELKSTTIALRKERDGLVDEWCTSFVERRIQHVKPADRQLAIQIGPKVRDLFVTASKGTFKLRNGLLQKSFPFRGSIRDVFIRESPKSLKSIGFQQLLDGVIAIFLHLAPTSVKQAFQKLDTDPFGAVLDLSILASGLQPARPARLDGVYLRYISEETARDHGLKRNYGPYIGISNDIGKRQTGHDRYTPVNRLVGKAIAKVPALEWKSLVVWHCGPTGLSELPKPVASLIESILIACLGTTVHRNPIQVNLFDTASYNPARYKRYSERSIQDACECIWDYLLEKVQNCPSKRMILPARYSDWFRTWTTQVGHIVCLYPGLTVRRAIDILFDNRVNDTTSSVDRLETIQNLRTYKQNKPIPASLFAISQFEDMVRRVDNSGERLTIFRNHPQTPIPATSHPNIQAALALAVRSVDAYIDEKDPHPTTFRRPEKRDRNGNIK